MVCSSSARGFCAPGEGRSSCVAASKGLIASEDYQRGPRKPGTGSKPSRSLGRAMGGHPYSRHHQAAGGGDACRGAAGAVAAADRALPVLPIRRASGCCIRKPANCCASTCVRSAASIASKTRTSRRKHRGARSPCSTAPTRAARASERCAALCTAKRVRLPCGAFWASCRWPSGTAAAHVDDACAVALEVGAVNYYRFVRRYLERDAQLPLSLWQLDPLIRQLTLYRDFIQNKKEVTMRTRSGAQVKP